MMQLACAGAVNSVEEIRRSIGNGRAGSGSQTFMDRVQYLASQKVAGSSPDERVTMRKPWITKNRK